MSNTPSETEIDNLLCKHWPGYSRQAVLVKMWLREAIESAIAKWGTPKQEAQEPVGVVEHAQAQTSYIHWTAAPPPNGAKLYTAPQPVPAPAPLSDDVVKDAARWRMAALIGNEVMLHPDKRTHATAVKAYMDATHSGSDLTGAVDAALAAQGGSNAE